ncbi:MAG: SDR family oxidoreductase [Anaerolineales bacterium]
MSEIPEMFELNGKGAIVTGGAGLLGSQFCKTLAQAGAGVAVVDINAPLIDKVVEEITAAGGNAIAVPTDITEPTSVEAMLEKTLEAFGRVDILVNSAALDPKFDPDSIGEQGANAFETFPLDGWKQALDVNLTGMFLCSQAAVKPMLEQGGGSIINLCSTYGLGGPDQRIYQQEGQPPKYKPVTYTVTKAGVVGMTKYLATYYGTKNIRVNSLTPGGVYNNHDPQFVEAYAYRTAMGRMAKQHEMNGALLFLASEASSYMTGSNLVVDGGWTAW